MRRVGRSIGVGLTIGLVACWTLSSSLATTVDFEGLITGQTVNGQAGWTVEDEFGNDAVANGKDPFDEEVVDDGTGNTVWRFSNAQADSSFSIQPYTQITTTPAGESGSALWNDRGTDHTMPLNPPNPGAYPGTTYFHGQFSFRSVTGAPQPDLTLGVSASAKQSSWRNSYLQLVDDGANGIDLFFYETGIESDPFGATANYPEIASDLSYGDWHTIDIYIEFVDGVHPDTLGNDCVTVVVDGSVTYTGSSWESYYRGSNPANLNPADQPQRQAVDSLTIYARGTDYPANAGNGFYFDDVTIDNEVGPVSCVAQLPTLSGWALGALALLLVTGITLAAIRMR